MRSCTERSLSSEIHAAARPNQGRDLRQLVQQSLERSSYSVLRRVQWEQSGTTVRLGGYLPSHYLKQVAQSVIADIDGVETVINEIEVVAPHRGAPESYPN